MFKSYIIKSKKSYIVNTFLSKMISSSDKKDKRVKRKKMKAPEEQKQ